VYPVITDTQALASVINQVPDWIFTGGRGTSFETDRSYVVPGQKYGVCSGNGFPDQVRRAHRRVGCDLDACASRGMVCQDSAPGAPVVNTCNGIAGGIPCVPDTNDDEIIRAAIYACTEKLCSQLRAKGLASRQALLSLKYTDDVCRRRGYRFGQTQAEQEICRVLFADYERFCDRRRRVRHLQVSLLGLYSYRLQPSLFERPKSSRLAPHLDAIRRRFGDDAVRYGKSIRARSGAA